jgi:hypothetical protein
MNFPMFKINQQRMHTIPRKHNITIRLSLNFNRKSITFCSYVYILIIFQFILIMILKLK